MITVMNNNNKISNYDIYDIIIYIQDIRYNETFINYLVKLYNLIM